VAPGERLCRVVVYKTKSHEASNSLSAHVEVLMVERRAANEIQNVERYEAAIQAMVDQVRDV
jgi:hypothetical protein